MRDRLIVYGSYTGMSNTHAAVAVLREGLPATTVMSAPLDAGTQREAGEPAPRLVVIDGSVEFSLAVAQCFRFTALEPEIPVVMIASHTEATSRATLRAGAAALIGAPIDPRRLIEAVRQLVGGAASGTMRAASTTRLAEQVYVDRQGRRLWVDGEERALSRQKFELLLYFADRPGRAIDARELIRAGLLRQSQAERYRGLIKELRDRLGSASDLLHVVPGYGYRWDSGEASELTG